MPAEAKVLPTHAGGWTTGRHQFGAMFFLLVVVLAGVGGFFLYALLKKDDPNTSKQANGSTDEPTEAPMRLPLDPLVEELQFWIAPTEEDLWPFADPASPQSQALALLQDDPITQLPG